MRTGGLGARTRIRVRSSRSPRIAGGHLARLLAGLPERLHTRRLARTHVRPPGRAHAPPFATQGRMRVPHEVPHAPPRAVLDAIKQDVRHAGRSADRVRPDSHVSDLGWFVFSAGGLVTALVPGAIWLLLRPASRLARQYLIAVSLAYAVGSTFAVSYGAGRLLATGFRPFAASDVPAGPRAILILGSGGYTATDWDGKRYPIIDPQAASRVLEAARVFRLTDPDWVISSGGLADPDDGRTPSGESMRAALIANGIPESRIIVDTNSANTHDEAVAAVPILKQFGIAHLIVVTSDLHMRRSLGAFRVERIRAIPAIARVDRGPLNWWDWIVPSDRGLAETALVAHETIGIAVYAWRGWYR
jgi:uncharacterized SAM-binding protein YcdF (DUF218 family)